MMTSPMLNIISRSFLITMLLHGLRYIFLPVHGQEECSVKVQERVERKKELILCYVKVDNVFCCSSVGRDL